MGVAEPVRNTEVSITGFAMRPKSAPDVFPSSLPDQAPAEEGFPYCFDPSFGTRSTRAAVAAGGYIRIANLPSVLKDQVSGKSPSPKSVYRWVASGHRGVRLKVRRLPFGMVTTLFWLEEFIQGINGNEEPALTSTVLRRRKQQGQARELAQKIVSRSTGANHRKLGENPKRPLVSLPSGEVSDGQ